MGRASLKQPATAKLVRQSKGFPGPMGRASLKRTCADVASNGPTKISRPYGPGLIEADEHGLGARALQDDFPALWAGPH